MAIGVPRKLSLLDEVNGGRDDGLSLTYQCKLPESEILNTAPAFPEPIAAGQTASGTSNRLYFGQNLSTLAHLLRDKEVCRKVKLIYIDPPFATQTVFHSRSLQPAYKDLLSGSQYIEFLRQRLVLLRELLADDGSIYVHLDAKMVFHIKLILDEVFGIGNFRNCITRKKCNPKNYTRKQYGNVSDYILFYARSSENVWNKPVEPWTEDRAKEYQYTDPVSGRRFMKVPIHAPGVRKGETGKPWRGMLPPPGKHWQFTPSTLEEMDRRGEIYWSPTGNPRRKVFLDESMGIGVQDIWMGFRDAHNQNVHITGYPTEKNPELLARIIEASSNPGDMVLDCFSGSGTTLTVAERLGRRWIGVDRSEEAIRATIQRFQSGLEPMGDFASNRESVLSSKERELSLFPDSEDHTAASVASQKHKPITNFVLYGDAEFRDDAQRVARNFTLFKEDIDTSSKPDFMSA